MDNCTEESLLSKEYVGKIIQNKLKSSEFEILEYQLKPISNCNGFLGYHTILHVVVNYEGSNRDFTFFSKQFPVQKTLIEFAERTGAFKKEIFIYNLFERIQNAGINFLSSCVPKCYFSENNKILIFDNLYDEGYKEINKHKTLDYDSIVIIVQSLAKLHASSLIFEEQQSQKHGHWYRLLEEYEESFQESYFKETQHSIISSSVNGVLGEADIFNFPELLPSSGKNFKKELENLCYKIYQYVKPSKKYRNVITHGDLWCTNFLMKYNEKNKPINCKLVDFQHSRYAPPAQDVLAALYLTTTREFRKKFMYEILGNYYATLEKLLKLFNYNLNNIMPFGEFMESCEDQKVFAIVQTSFYLPMVLVKTDLIRKYFEDQELYKKAFYEDRTHLIKAYLDEDEGYRKRLYDSMLDLKEYCELV